MLTNSLPKRIFIINFTGLPPALKLKYCCVLSKQVLMFSLVRLLFTVNIVVAKNGIKEKQKKAVWPLRLVLPSKNYISAV